MANGPDFGDIVAQGILEGFRNISPFMENQQKLKMLAEDRAFQQYISEENLALARAADLRAEGKAKLDAQVSRAQLEQVDRQMALEEKLAPLKIDEARAAIEASKATTEAQRATTNLRNLETAERAKATEARNAMVEQLKGNITDPTLLEFVGAYASNPSNTGDMIYEALQAKTRELAFPHLVRAIAEGKTPFRPEAADVIALQYKLSGRVDTDKLVGFLDTDKLAMKNQMLGAVMELAQASPDMTMEDFVPTVLGMGDVIDKQLEALGVIQKKGKKREVSPIVASLDRSPADEDPEKAAKKDAAVRRELGIGEPSGEAPKTAVEVAAIEEGGTAAAIKGGLKSEDIQRANYLRNNVDASIIDLAKNQPKELQTITAMAMSGGELGKFSAALAALAPGIAGGLPEDRLGAFSEGMEGLATLTGKENFDQALLMLNNIREDKNTTLQRKLEKMDEIFKKHLFKDGVNLMGDPEAEKKAYLEFENFLAFSDSKSGKLVFRAVGL